MTKPKAVSAAAVTAVFMLSSCYSVMVQPVPDTDARADIDLRGVVLGEGPARETFEFSEVLAVQWTESALVITGVVQAPGEAGHGQTSTITFPLEDVSDVLVREMDGTRASIIVAGVIMSAAIAIAFAVTGKSKDGVPIGSAR